MFPIVLAALALAGCAVVPVYPEYSYGPRYGYPGYGYPGYAYPGHYYRHGYYYPRGYWYQAP